MTPTNRSLRPDIDDTSPRNKSARSQPSASRYLFAVAAVVALTALAAGLVLQVRHSWSIRAYNNNAPVCRVKTGERIIALTFDDGPDPAHTLDVLELLTRREAHATFFVIGERALEHSRLTAEVVLSGNELGNHTWSHSNLTTLSLEGALNEIARGSRALAGYNAAPLVRAPYGEIGVRTLSAMDRFGLTAVHWSLPVDAYVSRIDGARATAAAIVADVSPGDILLAHDADDGGIRRDEAVAAIRELLAMLRSRVYKIVSASTLLEGRTPVHALPRPWFWQTGFNCPG